MSKPSLASVTKEIVATVMFMINEAEIEIGKLNTPNLTSMARQHLTDTAKGHLKAVKEQLNELLHMPEMLKPIDTSMLDELEASIEAEEAEAGIISEDNDDSIFTVDDEEPQANGKVKRR